MKLIRDRHGREGLLGKKYDTAPDPGWLAQLSKRPTDNPTWYTAYPLTGGSVGVQEGTFEVLREATPEDIAKALTEANFHGKIAIIKLLQGQS